MDQSMGTGNLPSGVPVLDLAAVTELREVFADDFDDILSQYLTDAERLMAAVGAAVAQEDTDGLRRATHAFQSTSATVGAQTLSRLCADVEELAGEGDLGAAAALLPALADQHEAATRAIRALQTGF